MSGIAIGLLVMVLIVAAGDWLAVLRQDQRLDFVYRPLLHVLLICLLVEIDPQSNDAWVWFLIALCFSLVGDLIQMLAKELFPLGLTFFLAANLAYLGGMLFLGVNALRLVIAAILVGGALALLLPRFIQSVQQKEAALVPPVQVYVGVMTAMVVAAFAVGRPVGIVGAGLCYASDALGGWNRFVRALPGMPLATTMAYQLGQLGLVLSLV